MIEIPYGSGKLNFSVDQGNCNILFPRIPEPGMNGGEIVKNSFGQPLGLSKKANLEGKTIGIAINDPTRPVPHGEMLLNLIDFLMENGAKTELITFYIANGTHKTVSDVEIKQYLPEQIWQEFKVNNHICDDQKNLVYLGDTKIGTPVWVNKDYSETDIKIVTGNIEPHHFMGYSGGAKSAAIGLVGRETIIKNHSLLTHHLTKMGIYNNNPMRQDIEEIGEIIGISYALNVIINANKQICNCYWGDPHDVVRAGIRYNREYIQLDYTDEKTKYDLVIASPGGYPKDINLYQAQKALTHACRFAKENAPIILVAECREGHGSNGFYDFFEGVASWQDVISKFKDGEFEIGPHKAYQLALQGIEHKIFLYSKLAHKEVKHLLLDPISCINEAIEMLQCDYEINNILVLPYATHTIPGGSVD